MMKPSLINIAVQVSVDSVSKSEHKDLLTPGETLLYALIAFGGLCLLIICAYLYLSYRTKGDAIFSSDAELDSNLLDDNGPTINDSQKINDVSESPAETLLTEELHTPVEEKPVATTTRQEQTQTSSPKPDDHYIENFCQRLDALGLLICKENSIIFSDTNTSGLVVRLKGNKLGLILSNWESDNFYHNQFKKYECIFSIQSDESIIVLENIESFLSHSMNLPQ